MIIVDKVSKRFEKLVALDNVSLTISPGERVALIGTNGSGKTTLLRAMCGLLRVDGRIDVYGVDIRKAPEVALRSVAYMPQVAPPLEAPVAELVRAYASLRQKTYAAVAAHAMQLGLDLGAVARVRVRDLSGGMKQKLLAAFALTSEAPMLVCDEPTASLDAAARAAFFGLVQARPITSILVLCSHRLDEVRQLVDRVVELKDGKIVHDGSVRELMARVAVDGTAPSDRAPRWGDSLPEQLALSAAARRAN